jgi:hypothetical protein
MAFKLSGILLLLLLPLQAWTAAAPPANQTLTTVEIYVSSAPFFHNGTAQDAVPEKRTVSYFVQDGLAIVDGDVIYGTETEIKAASVTTNKRAVSIFPFQSAQKWPGGVIRYKYEDDSVENSVGPDFQKAIEKWKNKLPFLQFTKEPSNSATLTPSVLTVFELPGELSYSYIGMAPFPLIRLGQPGVGNTEKWYAHALGHSKSTTNIHLETIS